MFKHKSDLVPTVVNYKAYAETHFASQGFHIQRFRLDRAGENFKGAMVPFCQQNRIELKPSPPYAPETNGTAERLVQEHWSKVRVLLFASVLPYELWGEALKHSNWLRNRSPSSRIDGEIPILRWENSARVDFKSFLDFGQPGYGCVYRSSTTAGKMLLPRSMLCHFVGMDSDTKIIRTYVPALKDISLSAEQISILSMTTSCLVYQASSMEFHGNIPLRLKTTLRVMQKSISLVA